MIARVPLCGLVCALLAAPAIAHEIEGVPTFEKLTFTVRWKRVAAEANIRKP